MSRSPDMLTEEKARLRWCALARELTKRGFNQWDNEKQRTVEATAFGGANRIADPYDGNAPHCLASACMAWRSDPQQARNEDARGYCGAFGRPA